MNIEIGRILIKTGSWLCLSIGIIAFALGQTLFIGATGSLLSLSFANGFFLLLTNRLSLKWYFVSYLVLGISIWQIWFMIFGLCCYDYDAPEQLIYDVWRILGTAGGISSLLGISIILFVKRKTIKTRD